MTARRSRSSSAPDTDASGEGAVGGKGRLEDASVRREERGRSGSVTVALDHRAATSCIYPWQRGFVCHRRRKLVPDLGDGQLAVPESLVVGAVPRNVAKRRQGRRRPIIARAPVLDVGDEPASNALPSVCGSDRHLFNVSIAVKQCCNDVASDAPLLLRHPDQSLTLITTQGLLIRYMIGDLWHVNRAKELAGLDLEQGQRGEVRRSR